MSNIFSLFRNAVGRKPIADRRLRWFGKLPTYGDYLAAPEPPAWAQEFGSWLIDGCGAYQAALNAVAMGATSSGGTFLVSSVLPSASPPKSPPNELQASPAAQGPPATDDRVSRAAPSPPRPPNAFPDALGIVRLAKSPITVAFAWRNFGGDAVRRPFPLAVFVGLPTEHCPGPIPEAMLAWARIFSVLFKNLDAISPATTPNELAALMRDQILEIDEPTTLRVGQTPEWKQIDWRRWYQPIQERLNSAAPGNWLAALQRWGRDIAAHDHGRYEYNLRFPLGGEGTWDVQIDAWLSWLAAYCRSDNTPLTLLCSDPHAPHQGSVSLLRRAIIPSDFLLLTGIAAGVRYVDDATRLLHDAVPHPTGDATPLPATWGDIVDFARGANAPATGASTLVGAPADQTSPPVA